VVDGYRAGIIDEAELREFEADCFVEEPEQGYAAEKSLEMERATA